MSSDNCHIYLIDDDCEKHWVSARNADHAVEVYASNEDRTVEQFREEYGDFKVSQLPDEQELPVGDFDEPETPPVVKTCAEWAAKGAGLVATTCF